MKKCCICKIEKEFSEFGKNSRSKDGLRSQCKQCRKEHYNENKEKMAEQRKIRYYKNIEKESKRSKEYREKHKPQAAEYKRKYYQIHRKEILENKKIYHSLPETKQRRQQYRNLPENKSRQRNWNNTRYHTDIQYKLTRILRSRLCSAIKIGQKAGSAVRDLGCSIVECKIHLENQFLPGMTWDNWGSGENDWQIDHIKPLFMFDLTNREEFLQACHYTNLRPLWKKDHMSRTYEEFD